MLHDRTAPPPGNAEWTTSGGIGVRREVRQVPSGALDEVVTQLDTYPGLHFSSSTVSQERYSIWGLGFHSPPIRITARGRSVDVAALNERGRVLLPAIGPAIADELEQVVYAPGNVSGLVPDTSDSVAEEERTRRPSVMRAIRAVVSVMTHEADTILGLYGAFGYDLIFQFMGATMSRERGPEDREVVIYLPDRLVVRGVDADVVIDYDFAFAGARTRGMPRTVRAEPYRGGREPVTDRDLPEGAYAELVRAAKIRFDAGQLFETVPGQAFYRSCPEGPAAVFRRLRTHNPAPYELFANLGEQEYLVGASPEMFVRVTTTGAHGSDSTDLGATALRVESCPISGTVPRGADALADAANVKALLDSAKETAELTMCTDVDRNDKARICIPGSIEVKGRRLIEVYATLIHTVDHVVGTVRDGMDALDAFLTHAWAVTVTGAPKRAAVEFIEANEGSVRRWYGGACGVVRFDGTLDTALTLRTIRIHDGVAEVRAGATLLHMSDPEAEERETELKASAALAALVPRPADGWDTPVCAAAGPARRVIVVDHQDSFVQNLASYFRQESVEVSTFDRDTALKVIAADPPDLVVLSPGPGLPEDHRMAETIELALGHRAAIFGVCLGMQGIAEYFGARLVSLNEPVHGRSSTISVASSGLLFNGVGAHFSAGRYHSWEVDRATLPPGLDVTASTTEGVVMALENADAGVAGVQFHPESIMTLGAGSRIIANVLAELGTRQYATARTVRAR